MNIKNSPEEIYWVKPHDIEYCTPSSEFTDLNQHEADRSHPHAFFDRGYFKENKRKGQVLSGDWDTGSLKFNQLIEFKAIYDHINGIKNWKKSKFAKRSANYIKKGEKAKGFTNVDEFLIQREKQINNLISSIQNKGLLSVKHTQDNSRKFDDISINVGRHGQLLFNNRGVHRLSIAKIINIEIIPVQVIIWHEYHKNNFII